MAVNLNTGIVLKAFKEPAVSRGLRSFLNPEEVYIPYQDSLRNTMRIMKDQEIYRDKDGIAFYAGIHGRFVRDVTIKNPDETSRYFVYKNMIGFDDESKQREIEHLTGDEILASAKDAGIIDENVSYGIGGIP